MKNTMTGAVTSGITEDMLDVLGLLGAAFVGKPAILSDVVISNTGDAALEIASLESDDGTAAEDIADSQINTIAVGESLPLAQVNLEKLFVRTVDDGESNSFEFAGTPV